MSNGALNSVYYKTAADSAHQLKVANDIYLQTSYPDSMWKRILNTPLSNDKSYKYSDLTFYFIQKIVERVSGQSLDQFVEKSFYGPMGLRSIGYNPLSKMSTSNIAPTENDALWRKQHIRGYVHDQGAAMLGGVGGHAGLFSNAQDLAAVMQMLLNRGEYGGVRYLSAEVIDEFNQRYYPGNRRGLGFDKPVLNGHGGSACDQASDSSFGHTGFTGTMCWADPETGLVFIFLSNRIDPDAENKKIQNLDIRTKIQSVFYNQCAN
jgi:CubicO group peptidase (beta-lactamase class C family)